jgi:hypothetical protein
MARFSVRSVNTGFQVLDNRTKKPVYLPTAHDGYTTASEHVAMAIARQHNEAYSTLISEGTIKAGRRADAA